jgi:outer membrane protein OmpA-like peptidoglycan-associated protein
MSSLWMRPSDYDMFPPHMAASRVSRFDHPDLEALLSGSKQRNWLFFGLIVSLVLHLALCFWFYRTRFQPLEAIVSEPPQTATFKVRNVDLNPNIDKNSADTTNPAAKPEPDKTDVQLPDEKKSFDKLLQEVQSTTAMPDDTRDALPDKPKVEQPDVTSVLGEIERSTAQTLSKNPNAMREQSLLNDTAISGRPQPALDGNELATSTTIKRPNSFTSKIQADSAGPTKGRAPGFSDLDQLLSMKGPLGSGTKLRMPEDQLFIFDSAELQPSAIAQLQKLGTLIQRNPKATFTVEGYTDSLGSPEYNLDLSQRRAESVKAYLVNVIGINPIQIETRGYGQTKFIVAPRTPQFIVEDEIARQRLNRRVEIVVHTNER